ncbi:MAG: PASTA domain-containing protein [Chitinivibrionia bacterium]|jgi:serine/threonine-protein kinase|nr:PASTA domain-containing protein [Chitinivibrionia bacterium]
MSSKYSFSISVKDFWLVLIPVLMLLTCAGGAFGFFVVDKIVMPKFTDLENRNDVVVPQLVGLDVETAAQTAFDLGLRTTRVSKREYSDVKPSNTVISQEPHSGTNVKRGRHISLTLSAGPEVGAIPAIEKLAEGPAKSALRQAGFENISVRTTFSERIPLDFAIETEPSSGTKTSRSAPVVLFISKGKRPTHASVPNVVGEMLSQAQTAIEASGLKFGRVRFEANSVMSAGQVISQSLTPGVDVPLESSIDVVVAAER